MKLLGPSWMRGALMDMKQLKWACVAFSGLLIAAALTGIQAVSTGSSGTTIVRFDMLGRILVLAYAVALAALAYGIQIRAKIVWKAGFAFLVLGYIYFVFGSTTSLFHIAAVRDFASFWLPTGIITLLGAGITIYWAVWWKRQRSYFY